MINFRHYFSHSNNLLQIDKNVLVFPLLGKKIYIKFSYLLPSFTFSLTPFTHVLPLPHHNSSMVRQPKPVCVCVCTFPLLEEEEEELVSGKGRNSREGKGREERRSVHSQLQSVWCERVSSAGACWCGLGVRESECVRIIPYTFIIILSILLVYRRE